MVSPPLRGTTLMSLSPWRAKSSSVSTSSSRCKTKITRFCQDLLLAGGQDLVGCFLAMADPVEVVTDQGGDRARVEEGLAAHGGPAGGDQVPVGRPTSARIHRPRP